MTKFLIGLALFCSGLVAHAQDTSASSQAGSASQAGAQSGSVAAGNVIVFNPSSAGATAQGAGGIPTTRVINEQAGDTRYSGVVENRTTGGTYNTVNENVRYSGTQTLKNVPSIAMSGPASGPCTGVSGGLGVSGPGWGLGFNGANVEPSCVLRENIRVTGMAYQSMGSDDPQERGELKVMLMDQMRGLNQLSQKLYNAEMAKK